MYNGQPDKGGYYPPQAPPNAYGGQGYGGPPYGGGYDPNQNMMGGPGGYPQVQQPYQQNPQTIMVQDRQANDAADGCCACCCGAFWATICCGCCFF